MLISTVYITSRFRTSVILAWLCRLEGERTAWNNSRIEQFMPVLDKSPAKKTDRDLWYFKIIGDKNIVLEVAIKFAACEANAST
jgi:hypothetical protein